jgi:tRNA (cytidine/uridine-2'-O-)-methyltransferase
MSAIVLRPGFLSEPLETGRNLEERRAARKRTDAKVAPRRGGDLRLALYQPDIAVNAGATLRLGACLGVPVVVVEPCGFVWDDRRLRRAGLDYLDPALLARMPSWADFERWRCAERRRLILLTTSAARAHHEVGYRPGDVLLGGRESAGVPAEIHGSADLRVRVPMVPGRRALNLVTALAIVLGEALRQTEGFP